MLGDFCTPLQGWGQHCKRRPARQVKDGRVSRFCEHTAWALCGRKGDLGWGGSFDRWIQGVWILLLGCFCWVMIVWLSYWLELIQAYGKNENESWGLAISLFSFPFAVDIVRSDIALDKQKGCKIAQHPDIMLELQREKAAQMHLVLLKEQFSNTYSNLTLTGKATRPALEPGAGSSSC